MEAKLIKTKSTYHLVVNNKIIASMGDSDGKLQKLSLKNCEAIANGYDLDELVEDNFKGLRACIEDQDIAEFYISLVKTTITEILGDKKFTKEDMGRIMVYGYDKSTENEYLSRIPFDEYIQSLQQTEWDVEVETEEKRIGGIKGYGEYEIVPKLDADGCLILKRK
jgi:hypothetical protein